MQLRSDSGSDTDDDEAARQKKKELVPEWAHTENLREALTRQYGLNGHTPVDPDTIFPEVNTCNLEEIFGCRAGKSGVSYSKRTSSAHWDADEISLVERRNYRQFLGFRNSFAQPPLMNGIGGTSPPTKTMAMAGGGVGSHHAHGNLLSMPVNAHRPLTSITATSQSQMR